MRKTIALILQTAEENFREHNLQHAIGDEGDIFRIPCRYYSHAARSRQVLPRLLGNYQNV